MVFIYNKQRTRSCAQLTAHLKKLRWFKVGDLFRGEMAVLGFQSPCGGGGNIPDVFLPIKGPKLDLKTKCRR